MPHEYIERGDYAAYAALWGCDPCYDRAPRLPGDGYLFYNFSAEGRDPKFLEKFLPAIDRTIQGITGKTKQDKDDKHDLGELAAEVRRRLA